MGIALLFPRPGDEREALLLAVADFGSHPPLFPAHLASSFAFLHPSTFSLVNVPEGFGGADLGDE
jgi:hypothetical protein